MGSSLNEVLMRNILSYGEWAANVKVGDVVACRHSTQELTQNNTYVVMETYQENGRGALIFAVMNDYGSISSHPAMAFYDYGVWLKMALSDAMNALIQERKDRKRNTYL